MSSSSAAFCTTTTLVSPPLDAISRVRFPVQATRSYGVGNIPAHLLAVSSWDGSCRLYDTNRNSLLATRKEHYPLLDVTFSDPSQAVCATLGGALVLIDFNQGGKEVNRVDKFHSLPASCVEKCLLDQDLVVSGGWDRTIRLWDTRTREESAKCTAAKGKIFCMALDPSNGTRVIAGTSMREVLILDIRNLSTPVQVRDSPFSQPMRCMAIHPMGTGFVCGSQEGKAAWEPFEHSDKVRGKYTFKCHHKKSVGSDDQDVSAVNGVAFHPKHGTFATCGSDGVVSVWDGEARKRLWRMTADEVASGGVSSVSFSPDGTRLAMGVSYCFDNGPKSPEPPRAVIVRPVSDVEMQAKKRVD